MGRIIMARHRIPQVIDDHLKLLDELDGNRPAILVGSSAWYAWLKAGIAQSFAFHSAQGTMTVRREQCHGNWYWYAYRTQQGQHLKAYLGKLEELTPERLHDVADTLVVHTLPHRQGPNANTVPPAFLSSEPLTQPSVGPKTNRHDEALLATKLFTPPPAPTLVARPRLFTQLTAGARCSLTLVTAPAGWGKTTLLSAWHADPGGSPAPVAWVSLDAGDNDPARFWTYVITALNTLYTGVGKITLALLRSARPPPMESVLTTLLNDLAGQPLEGVLVLDDYHVIESRPIHAALVFLLEHLPPWLHLVIATRLDPPFPLARLRARGALTEIRASDLGFTSEEAAEYLTEVMGLPLSIEQVAALEAHTEGWIAGLHLAALSAQGRSMQHLAHFVEAFTGSNRFVLEYLTEEVLGCLTEELQTFLLYTSLLDRLCAPLCDALLSSEHGKAEADQTQCAHHLLEYLERANLFLIPLDDEQYWYRYHHLFADVLRSRLKRTQPTLVPELHRRASAWYEQHGLYNEAMQHALAAPDIERAARLIEQVGLSTGIREQVHTVLGWLNTLPDAFVRTRPTLCIYKAVTLMLTNQLEAAEARLQDAERCLQADIPPEQVRTMLGQIATVRGNLARLTGHLARSVALSHEGLDLLPETEPIFRASVRVDAAHAYLVSGDVTPASERLVAEVVASVGASGDLSATLRGITLLARLQVLQGRLRQAAATYREAAHVAPGQESLQALVGSPAYYFGIGDLLREWNDLDAAERHLVQGMEEVWGTLTVDAKVVTQGYISLARLKQARGDDTGALATLHELGHLARQRAFIPHLVARGAAVQARIELAQGDLEGATRWADASGLSVEDNLSYPQEVEFLTLARIRIAQGRAAPNGPFLKDALRLLERLLHDAEGKARMSSSIEILALRALASSAQGNSIVALTALERAVALAEPEGYLRLFLDEGEPMLVLLSKLLATGHRARSYLHRVLAAGDLEPGRGASPAPARMYSTPSQSLIDPLSERELEVLHLIVTGASNYEIAERLVVAVSTVKRHVSNIFSKLAVTNRTQAAAHAREVGLL